MRVLSIVSSTILTRLLAEHCIIHSADKTADGSDIVAMSALRPSDAVDTLCASCLAWLKCLNCLISAMVYSCAGAYRHMLIATHWCTCLLC